MNKKSMVAIIVLSLLVIGLSGYIVYDKAFKKRETNAIIVTPNKPEVNPDPDVTPEPETDEQIEFATDINEIADVEKERVKKILNKVISLGDNNSFESGYTEKIKKYIALMNTESKETTCDSIYKNSKAKYDEGSGSYEINTTDRVFYCDENKTTFIKYNDLVNTYKSLFVDYSEIKKEGIEVPYGYYDYDKKTDSFVDLSCRCGGDDPEIYFYEISSLQETDTDLIVEVGYIVFTRTDDYIFESVIDNNKIAYSSEEIYDEKFESEFFGEYLKELPKYRFKFEKKDGNYLLKSFNKVK